MYAFDSVFQYIGCIDFMQYGKMLLASSFSHRNYFSVKGINYKYISLCSYIFVRTFMETMCTSCLHHVL